MSFIEISTTGPVRTVMLARPEKRNALNPAMMAEIEAAFKVMPPPEERVTVIRAQGPAFCSGLELAATGVDANETLRIEAMFDAVFRYPLPVVAIVEGAAVAGGCELALHCDFVVARNDATLWMPLSQFGVSTTWFLTKKIMHTAGPALAREFLLLGDAMPAARLHEVGIVTRAVAAARLEEVATTLIYRLAANAPLSLKTMKEIMVRQTDTLFDAPHADIDEVARKVYATRDAIEGTAARVERRQAVFTGSWDT